MIPFTIIALLGATPSSVATPGDSLPSLLQLVPENSFALVHCEDAAALRSRAERNEWFKLMKSEVGAPMLLDLSAEFRSETNTDLVELLEVGQELQGESVLFLTRQVAGFWTEAPTERARLVEEMRAWLPDAGPGAVSRTRDLGVATLEVVAWPECDAYGWRKREGHFAAFVNHPQLLGLFSGDDAESLMLTLEASLARLGSEQPAPLVEAFEAARAKTPDCHGVEVYVDFSPFVAEAEREMAKLLEGMLPDPSGLLGVDRGLWLLSASDIHPGTRVDSSAWINVPKDTLAAKLADTFQALPADLPARLPGKLASVYALRWDVKLFYARLRAAIEERHGEESLEAVDSALAAAQAMGGVDPIIDVLNQLDGTFAFYDMLPDESDDPRFSFDNYGFLATLVDGEAFLESFERLTEIGSLESELDLIDIEGVDVYCLGDDADDGGLAILPKALVVGLGGSVRRSLRAATGTAEASLLDGSDIHGVFVQNQGCCFIAAQRLADVAPKSMRDMAGADELLDSLLTYTARRTAEGFNFELHTE